MRSWKLSTQAWGTPCIESCKKGVINCRRLMLECTCVLATLDKDNVWLNASL